MTRRVYLDWNATAPLRPEARDAMLAAMDVAGNPSSVHSEGRAARAIVERARAQVATLCGCKPGEVVFTSGATEAASVLADVALCGAVQVEDTAHDAVWARHDPTRTGGRGTTLAMGLANSETGVVRFPPEKGDDGWSCGDAFAQSLFLDVTQAVGRIAWSFHWSGADMACLSAHKLGGPKGVGALLIRDGLDFGGLQKGGGQELGRRSGTENVVGIAGFGAACAAAQRDLDHGAWDRIEKLRNILENALASQTKETIFVGIDAPRLTDIEMEYAPKGLTEDIVRLISAKNNEPDWMTEWRLDAYRRWLQMEEPDWAMVDYPKIDFQDQYYYAKPKSMQEKPKSLDEVDPKLLETYEKLGIPLKEQMILAGVEGAGNMPEEGRKVAVDAVFDSVSVGTTFKDELAKAGVIFCSISEAIQEHPELVKKYLASVVPVTDNYYATLNSAVFSDGSFVYVPEGVRCPMELSTYFRINAENTGQFERTLIIADKGAYVSYLEGCTAPQRDTSQLHAAVVELVVMDDAEIKYSTVQNWFPGDENGRGGIYNFVTKRADCRGDRSKVMWTQVETGSSVTWKYPSCILRGDDSQGEFYSIAITNNMQQADTGTKMVHLGKNTKSRIVSKGISAGKAQNTYRGLVSMHPKAKDSRNYTQCDSLLIGDKCGAHTVPYIEVKNNSSRVEHEATTSKVDDDQLFYCRQRGMDEEEAVALVVNGFCKEVLQALPMEFAMEAQQLVAISLEGSVG